MIYTQEEIIRDIAIGGSINNPNMKKKEFKLIEIKSFTKDSIFALFTINDERSFFNFTGETANEIYSIYNKQFPKFK